MHSTLYIFANAGVLQRYTDAAAMYNARPYSERDSGFDLYLESNHQMTAGSVYRLSTGIRAMSVNSETGLNEGFCLYARSSVSRYPMMLANSVGIIDPTYRGIISGAFYVFLDITVNQGERYLQLTHPSLMPWNTVEIVESLPTTSRGEGGYGSTGIL